MNIFRRFLNLALRGLNMSSKFLLIFFLAKMLPSTDFGLYNLIVVTATFIMYLYGLDFYIFASREIILASQEKRSVFFQNQLILYVCTYLLFSPFLIVLFVSGKLPWYLLPLFLTVCLLQHIAQEINRLLINLSSPLWASVTLFVRSGLWCLVVIILMVFSPKFRSLDLVLYSWIIGLILSIFIAFIRLKFIQFPIKFSLKVDINWIKRGLSVSLPFLMGTLSLVAIGMVDRYWIEGLFNLKMVGVYGFFASIANSMTAILDAVVFSFAYPKLIEAAGKSNELFGNEYKNFKKQTIIVTFIFSIFLSVSIYPLVIWINNTLYIENIMTFFILLLSNIFIALSMIPHYGLYAKKQDKPIIKAHIISILILLSCLFIFAQSYYLAVSISVCLTSLFLLTFKAYSFYNKASVEPLL